MRLYWVDVEETTTREATVWVWAASPAEAEDEAEEVFQNDELSHSEWDEISTRSYTEGSSYYPPEGPKDGDEVVFDGKIVTWPIRDSDNLTEQQRRYIEIAESIHPKQGTLV